MPRRGHRCSVLPGATGPCRRRRCGSVHCRWRPRRRLAGCRRGLRPVLPALDGAVRRPGQQPVRRRDQRRRCPLPARQSAVACGRARHRVDPGRHGIVLWVRRAASRRLPCRRRCRGRHHRRLGRVLANSPDHTRVLLGGGRRRVRPQQRRCIDGVPICDAGPHRRRCGRHPHARCAGHLERPVHTHQGVCTERRTCCDRRAVASPTHVPAGVQPHRRGHSVLRQPRHLQPAGCECHRRRVCQRRRQRRDPAVGGVRRVTRGWLQLPDDQQQPGYTRRLALHVPVECAVGDVQRRRRARPTWLDSGHGEAVDEELRRRGE